MTFQGLEMFNFKFKDSLMLSVADLYERELSS